MNEQEKKRQIIYDLLNTETKLKQIYEKWKFLWAPSSQDHPHPRLRYMTRFRIKTKFQLSIQILVC